MSEAPSDNHDTPAVLTRMVEHLRAGYGLVIFPEGSRSFERKLRRFRRGAIEAAIRAEVPIVPAFIGVNPPVLMKHQPWYEVPDRRADFRIEFFPVIETRGRNLDPRAVNHDLKLIYEARFLELLRERDAHALAPAPTSSAATDSYENSPPRIFLPLESRKTLLLSLRALLPLGKFDGTFFPKMPPEQNILSSSQVGPGSTRAGHFITQNPGIAAYRAFIPAPLPPNPPLLRSARMDDRLQRANLAVGRLDGISRFLPNADAFFYMYIRKEAVLSSQIEGTQSTLSDLLRHEHEGAPGVPKGDVEEVSNYVRAMYCGIDLLREQLPLSLRLIREVHRTLVSGTRGADKTPGEFRRSQNWIGGSRPGDARFVPPPPHEVMPALGALERFLHDDPEPTPPLLKAGFTHAQFETIHPFLDGNGRVGRLLITMILLAEKVLAHPMLYMSLHFKRNQSEYYERLQRVRTHGDWEGWIEFYLEGVGSVATQAVETIDKLHELFASDRASLERTGTSVYQQTASLNNRRVFELLCRRIALTGPSTASELGISRPTASRVLQELAALGIVQEVTGQARNRLYIYTRCVRILEDGT